MVEFMLILGFLVIYFAPGLYAAWVRHPKLAYIGGLNAVFGVTIVGWVGALMWALRRRKVIARSYHGDMALPRSFNASLLAVCALVVGSAVIATVFVERLRVNHRAYVAQALYTAPAASAPQWTFTTPSAGVSLATLVSTNSLVQPSPFKGGLATLGVAHGPDGDTIRLDIDGEMTCSYAPTASSVDISFDGGPTQSFACAPAPAGARKMLFDGDHSTAYLADPITFLDRLKAAHHITINAAFAAQSDPQAIEFDLPQADPVAAAPAGVGGQSPALAMAAVSSLPAAAGAATVPLGTQATVTPAVKSDDAAGEGDHHGHGHRGHHHHHR